MGNKITFCTYDAPKFHGPNSWLKRLLPGLNKHGYTIQVLIFYEDDLENCETYQHFLKLGLTVNSFPFTSIAEEKISWILRTLSPDPPDIFVPNMLVHAFFAAGFLRKSGIATIGLIHSDEKFYDGIIEEFVNGEEKFEATAVVACSKYLYEKVSSKKTRETICRFIPYGVPVTNIPRANFNTEKLSLIYAGRLAEKQKRITEVVMAICKASNEIKGVEGIIYGNGQNKKVIRLIEKYSRNNKVKFGGSVPNSEIYNILSQAQVFVLLSDYEGLPQTLLEAMACGLVPVCTNMKSGIPELIVNNQTGIIVKDRNIEFVSAIKRLKKDADLCQEISKNVQEKVQSYSTEICLGSWVRLIEELLVNQKTIHPIEIPEKIDLPKPHQYLRTEDFRTPTVANLILQAVRNSTLFRLLKKMVRRS
jgi:colanic acid/amylovoran biosynthesis glycosyltransferase